MCTPTLAGVIAGGAQTIGGIMSAQAKHNQAKAAARRANLINQLTFKNQMAQKARADQLKADSYTRQLEAHASAQQALQIQKNLNQMERDRVSVVAQQALKEQVTETAFESQEKMIAQIQAQGTVLAGSQQAGQSMLLSIMETERQLGMQEAQLTARLEDANTSFRLQEYGYDLDKHSADMMAMNRLPGAPVAEMASFGPIGRPNDPGPSGLGLMGGIISSVGSGFGTGIKAAQGARDLGWGLAPGESY